MIEKEANKYPLEEEYFLQDSESVYGKSPMGKFKDTHNNDLLGLKSAYYGDNSILDSTHKIFDHNPRFMEGNSE